MHSSFLLNVILAVQFKKAEQNSLLRTDRLQPIKHRHTTKIRKDINYKETALGRDVEIQT